MSHIFDKKKASPRVAAVLGEIQKVLKEHGASLSGSFAVHLDTTKEGDIEHRRADGESLYHLATIDGDTIERWH